ncbi:YheC/YheD family protein [Tumebacillus permanentifrigoris]|uniref:YheC/D-like protein n=1 Tax=Tumebacillus permanentifrigoris TaxID=378543 RepID=A0A316DC24_9BACL|nr:YheC/YheD family protein [Tumebacillus permanentifrigoris]PWK15515.1 YheC/D-like protein [Tumebacillus permanentifrigoris]
MADIALGTTRIASWPGTHEHILSLPGNWHEHLTLHARDQITVRVGNRQTKAQAVFTDEGEVQATDRLRLALHLPLGAISVKVVDGVLNFGPFVGLYCAPTQTPGKPYGGLTSLVRDMLLLAQQEGVALYVFTPGDARWKEGWVNASIYNPTTQTWQKAKRPLPDLVIPKILGTPAIWREEVRHDQSQFRRLVPFGTFNNATGNKWTVHQQLYAEAALRRWLPETQLISRPQDVDGLLERHNSVYIKPALGTQGMSIYKLDLEKKREPAPAKSAPKTSAPHLLVQHRSASQSLHRRFRLGSPTFHSFVQKKFLARRKFLVQQTLQLLTLRGGRPVDFRWLVQKDGSNSWCITARIARVGAANGLTTNLHTGGEAVLAETLLQKNGWRDPASRRRLLTEIDDAALAICRTLEENAGRIGELGLDFGITQQGAVYLIEVNPRPGRQMLLDTSPEARRLSLLRNLEYARSTTGYQP